MMKNGIFVLTHKLNGIFASATYAKRELSDAYLFKSTRLNDHIESVMRNRIAFLYSEI